MSNYENIVGALESKFSQFESMDLVNLPVMQKAKISAEIEKLQSDLNVYAKVNAKANELAGKCFELRTALVMSTQNTQESTRAKRAKVISTQGMNTEGYNISWLNG